MAVEDQEDLHRCVTDALVAVDEGMVRHQREAQRGRLLQKRGVEVRASEALARLRKRGLEQSEVAQPDSAAGLLGDAAIAFAPGGAFATDMYIAQSSVLNGFDDAPGAIQRLTSDGAPGIWPVSPCWCPRLPVYSSLAST